MKIKITAIISFLIMLFLYHPLIGQQTSTPFFANYDGVGYTGTGNTKSMNLSNVTVGSTYPENFAVNNNTIIVGKSGLYNIKISAGISGNDIISQELGYNIYINNNLVSSANYTNIPSSGMYEIQKNLNQGDIIAITVTKNFDFPIDSGVNKISLIKM